MRRSFLKTNRMGLYLGPLPAPVDYRLISPIARSIPALVIVGVMAAVFTAIEVSVMGSAIDSWHQFDQLFMLTTALFQTFWLMAWSVGTVALVVVFIVMLCGRQAVVVHAGRVDFILGIPGIGFRLSIAANEVTDVALVDADSSSIFPKIGKQLTIETGDDHNNTPFGSEMTEVDLSRLSQAIQLNRSVASGLDIIPHATEQPTPETSANLSQALDKTPMAPISWYSPSSLLLILANLVPLLGVVLLDWDLGSIMVLYWAETAIILLYNVIKLVISRGWLGLFIGLFSIAHAGAFMAVHFLFIWGLFVQGIDSGGSPESENLSTVIAYLTQLLPALLALLISHGFSLKANYLDRHAQHSVSDLNPQNQGFYSRIILMHLTIIFGGGAAMLLGSGLAAITLLLVLKIVVDLRAHLKLHNASFDNQPTKTP